MAEYKLSVTTGGMRHAGTLDNIFIILFGTEGQSERTRLDNSGIDFKLGTASSILSYVTIKKTQQIISHLFGFNPLGGLHFTFFFVLRQGLTV